MAIEISGKKLYSAIEAAELIGRHRLTILKWIRDKKIADVRRNFRKERVWTDEDIDQFRKFAKEMDQLIITSRERRKKI